MMKNVQVAAYFWDSGDQCCNFEMASPNKLLKDWWFWLQIGTVIVLQIMSIKLLWKSWSKLTCWRILFFQSQILVHSTVGRLVRAWLYKAVTLLQNVQRPAFHFTPRGEIWSQGVRLAPRGELCPPRSEDRLFAPSFF
jgi:hypothetical protein